MEEKIKIRSSLTLHAPEGNVKTVPIREGGLKWLAQAADKRMQRLRDEGATPESNPF